MEIKVESKSKKNADIIKENYCGKYSDLLSFLLYKYQYIYFLNEDSYFASNMNKLSNDSLVHFEIIGKLIKLLGDDPIINNIDLNENYFTTDKEKVLEIDIRLTKEKIINYTKSLNNINDDNIKDILNDFIIEERKNLEILEILQLKYKREKFY